MSDGITDSMFASAEDTYAREIARIKQAGELDALREALIRRKHYFSDEAWNNTESAGTFRKLGLAITRAEKKLREMRMLLAEMHNLDPNNN